jgi:predicted metal-dependent hydrolase
LRASEKWLHSVLQDKSAWVVEKLDSWSQRKGEPQQWHDCASVPFRGEQFTLRIMPSLFDSPAELRGEHLIVYVRDLDDHARIQRVVIEWYRHEALRVFEECVAHFVPLIQISPSQIKLSSARTQWGSCTVQGVVRLNWRLVKLPLHLIDYVVAHELAHLIEMNHSERFWRVVASVCPDYHACRKELHDYGIVE